MKITCVSINAAKSKCLVILPISRRSLAKEFQSCIFYVGTKAIEHVKSFLYLSYSVGLPWNSTKTNLLLLSLAYYRSN